jgi:hypothetical protein
LDKWRQTKISGRADWFAMPIFRDTDYETATVRFVKGSIAPSRQDGEWIVSAKVELYTLSTLTDDALSAAVAIDATADLPAWPQDALGYEPLAEDYAVTLPDTLVRADFDQGSLDQVQPFVNGPAMFAVSWPFTDAQYAIFRAWVALILIDGGRRFTVPLFYGADYVTIEARFVAGTVTASRVGDGWQVKAQVETASLLPSDDSQLVFYLAIQTQFDKLIFTVIAEALN